MTKQVAINIKLNAIPLNRATREFCGVLEHRSRLRRCNIGMGRVARAHINSAQQLWIATQTLRFHNHGRLLRALFGQQSTRPRHPCGQVRPERIQLCPQGITHFIRFGGDISVIIQSRS